VYLETGEPALVEAMHRLWDDTASTKLFITGEMSARFDGQAFGGSYELPAGQCYCETCAAIGSLMRLAAERFRLVACEDEMVRPTADRACAPRFSSEYFYDQRRERVDNPCSLRRLGRGVHYYQYHS
jgi:hypothetical protein